MLVTRIPDALDVEDWMDILHEADDFGAGTIAYCGVYVVSEPLSRSLLLNVCCRCYTTFPAEEGTSEGRV